MSAKFELLIRNFGDTVLAKNLSRILTIKESKSKSGTNETVKIKDLIFASTGVIGEEFPVDQIKERLGELVEKLRKGKIKVKKNAVVTIQNIVASINLGGRIHLEQAARTLPRSMYEPEQFPGLIHRMLDPKTVILLFSSGKLVCTGAKKEEDVYRSVNNLHALLEEKKLMVYE